MFRFQAGGYGEAMLDIESIPQPGERWLSRPPRPLVAHVLWVEPRAEPPLVGYELRGEDGACLETVEHAVLDRGWWDAFQPIVPRHG